MDRFDELLSDYVHGSLDADGRVELGSLIETDPACLEAFLDAVSELRIRRLELQRI
jgi:anti-sigma factor RsiW